MKRRSSQRGLSATPQPLKRSRRLEEKREAQRRQWAEMAGLQPPSDPAGPLRITDLPPEVMLEIFSWLTFAEIEAGAGRVCVQWARLAQSSCLRKSLTLRGETFCTETALRFLQASPRLESLELVERKDAAEILQAVSAGNRNLRRLVVKRCYSEPDKALVPARFLQNIVHRCRGITDITIKDTQFRSNKFYRDLGAYLPKLRRVNFSYNAQFGSVALNAILDGCSHGLEEVNAYRPFSFNTSLSHCQDADVERLSQLMRASLAVLKLNANLLTDRSMSAVAECSKMRTLHLMYAVNVTDAGVDSLAKLHGMVSLHMSTMRLVSSDAWVRMFGAGSWRQLRSLMLSICLNVDDAVLYAVAAACPNLERLNLSGCVHVTGEGLGRIVTMCHKLLDLNVYFTHVLVVRSFDLIPVHTPNLKTLIFRPLGFQEEMQALVRLRKALPRLKIMYDDVSKRDTHWRTVNHQ